MISVDRLVLYRCDNEYKFAIINKLKTSVALVVENKIIDLDKEKVFSFKYTAGNCIDDEWEVESTSFRDFLHLALADSDRKDIIYPPASLLPDYNKFKKIKKQIPCMGINLEREELRQIEKYLNKTVFKNIVKYEQAKQKAKQKIEDIEYADF